MTAVQANKRTQLGSVDQLQKFNRQLQPSMARIPKELDDLPIGRQITRKITGVGTEVGVVVGLKLASVPGWTCIFHVKWETPDKKSFAEDLALTTIQSYYSESDTYVDEPFVADDVRLRQKVRV